MIKSHNRLLIALVISTSILLTSGYLLYQNFNLEQIVDSNIIVPTPISDSINPEQITTYSEPTSVDLNVLVLEYYPDENKDGIIDAVAGRDVNGQTIAYLKSKVANLNLQTALALTNGTKYKGYKENSQPYINYKIIDKKIFDNPIPISTDFEPFADHFMILQQDIEICKYIEEQDVKEVWIWMYHSDYVVPIESNMASQLGDVSNSYRQNDLPLCGKTYTVYNYNYGREIGEAVENHTHQIEHVLNWVDGRDITPADQWDDLLFWGKFVGSDITHKIIKPGCGWTHYPPNGTSDYDWTNPQVVDSDCADWNPQATGIKAPVSCQTWSCGSKAGIDFKLWWMQNIPGYNNNITYQGKFLRNWWEFIADFDSAVSKGKLLTYSASPSITPTPTITMGASPSPTPQQSPTVTIVVSPSPASSPTPRTNSGGGGGGGGNRPSATPAIKERGFENISSTVQSCVNNYSKDNDRLTDIKNDSFEGYIISLNCRDAIKGFPDKTYRSDEKITRGQMAKYIMNSFKIPINNSGSTFIDIKNDEIFYDYIITLKNSNITSGYSDGTYRPGDFVKRQEVSKFIVEAIKVKSVNIYYKDASYTDLDAFNKFRGYIGFLSSEDVNNEKIIQGFSDGSYRPNDYVTRGQMAKIIENSVRYLEKHKAI